MNTEKELIKKLQQLKKIEPKQDWVVLTKKSILGMPQAPVVFARPAGIFPALPEAFYSFITNRKMAYSFAVLLLTVVSLHLLQIPVPNGQDGTLAILTSQSPAALSNAVELEIMAEMERIKEKSRVLAREYPRSQDGNPQEDAPLQKEAKVAKVKELKAMVNNMTSAAQKDPRLAKVIASQIENSVTYLNVIDSEDLQETSGTFVKTIVEGMFDYYKTVTLSSEKQSELADLKKSYQVGKITASQALEAMLLFNEVPQDGNESPAPDGTAGQDNPLVTPGAN